MTARVDRAPAAPTRVPRITGRRVTAVLGHAYVWFCLFLFVLPFAALLFRSFAAYGGSSGLENYRGAIGDFKENLFWSAKITGLARRDMHSFGTPSRDAGSSSRSCSCRCTCRAPSSASRSC